jgi:NADH-ubiquinone oxidoreductase chain 5
MCYTVWSWEGIGISSYLLINFWFTRIQANKSAIKALVVNRVGDIFFSIRFFAIFINFGNLNFSTIFSLTPFINETIITFIGFILRFAAMGKSAQFGLHTWLPDQRKIKNQVLIILFLLYIYILIYLII